MTQEKAEAVVGKEVAAYLRKLPRGLSIDLCFGLITLLEHHWSRRHPQTPRWFDGPQEWHRQLPHRPGVLFFKGVICWGEQGRQEQWFEALTADFKVEKEQDKLRSYTIRFGRKGVEERRLPIVDPSRVMLLRELEKPKEWEPAEVFEG
jgi:hypothetical protein